ncbi:MAG: F0F1 ATP synthase subunit epsilon [Candidatus Saccharimonadales bacterium]
MDNPSVTKTKSPTMRVKVYAPFRVYYDGPAASVSANNTVGPFDVLPHHRNFITLLEPGNITVRIPNKNDFNLPITRGIMHVRADDVRVFLDV